MNEIKTVPLYRVENPSVSATPDGIVSHDDLIGQWFSPDIDYVSHYLRKSTQTFGKQASPILGARLVIAHVPEADLPTYHVFSHPVAKDMDVENNNYLIPRDGSVPTTAIELDEIIGDLSGSLGSLDKLKEARQRIVDRLGELSVES